MLTDLNVDLISPTLQLSTMKSNFLKVVISEIQPQMYLSQSFCLSSFDLSKFLSCLYLLSSTPLIQSLQITSSKLHFSKKNIYSKMRECSRTKNLVIKANCFQVSGLIDFIDQFLSICIEW